MDIDKLETTPVDLRKLRHVVKMILLKKKKVNAIDSDKQNLEKKNEDVDKKYFMPVKLLKLKISIY